MYANVNAQAAPVVSLPPSSYWRGLGLWNLYFIAKLVLYSAGLLNLHAFENLIFVAALLFPLPPLWLHRVRHAFAVPLGMALLYRDTWFPPFNRLLAQPEILNFSGDYLIELLGRFINWDLMGAGFILVVAYMFIAPWVRLTLLSVTGIAWLSVASMITLPSWLSEQEMAVPARTMQVAKAPVGGSVSVTMPGEVTVPAVEPVVHQGKPGNPQLNDALQAFYDYEAGRQTAFAPDSDAVPFDLLFVNICSLSWADLQQGNLQSHSLFKNLDVVFDDFNSATSYSGPAVLRLLRASCGQSSHAGLYETAPDQCYLFDNLKKLGFDTKTALNHNGQFQGFLDELSAQGRFPQPFIPENTRPTLTAFDGSPIWDDYSTLTQWWKTRNQSEAPRTALLYNTITLHDGNREATADGGGRTAPFQSRAITLLDELNRFIDDLEKSDRRVVVVLIPEHGAALEGDRMQIAGMREIPTSDITHVPVGVRVIGAPGKRAASPVHVKGPSSYLALSELVSRMVHADLFGSDSINWSALVEKLPETQPVSENDGTVLMPYNGVPYVRMGNQGWIEYPR